MSLPDSHRSSVSMARVLASYIDCPARIRREVQQSFNDAPCLETIRGYRAAHLRRRDQRPSYKPHEGYYPDAAYDAAAQASDEFLRRIQHERAA